MTNKDILVYINGEPFVCSTQMKLIDILIYLDFDIKLVTIEHNSKIIPQSVLSTVLLKSHDSVEVVTIVGGG